MIRKLLEILIAAQIGYLVAMAGCGDDPKTLPPDAGIDAPAASPVYTPRGTLVR